MYVDEWTADAYKCEVGLMGIGPTLGSMDSKAVRSVLIFVHVCVNFHAYGS